MFSGIGGRKEDYLLCVAFTGKKYTLKWFNPVFLPFLSGAFVLPVTTSGASQKDTRVTAALRQAPSELSHLTVQRAKPLATELKGKKSHPTWQ